MKIKIAISSTENKRFGKTRRFKAHRKIKSLMKALLNRDPAGYPLFAQLPESYPWSFFLPDRSGKRDNCFLGALAVGQGEQKEVFASYVALKAKQAEQLLLPHTHYTFWQARILAMLLNNEKSPLDYYQWREWLLSLERSFFPGWRAGFFSTTNNFSNRKNLLLSTCCKTDFDLSADAGVELMPWKDWPFCLRHSDKAWLWRQSRQGRIIDSQRIMFL